MIEDAELLRRYATTRAEDDFAELVRRHVNLVYSAALRQVNGDAHLAQDVTQLVFADLARKAESVASHRVLAGWLFTSTRFAAAKAVRGERRRQARETEAHLMQELFLPDDPAAQLDWARVRPVLDDVLGELGEADREAILLRFFEGRDFASVGARLSLNDNTARMRVERALDKLRALLERRGVTSTSAALGAALANQAVVAAPAGLVTTVTGAALAGAGMSAVAGSAGATASAGVLATFMSMTKLQVGITGAIAITGAMGYVTQARSNAALQNEVASLRQENAAIAPLQAENTKLARTSAEVADLRGDDAQLARLGEESVALKGRLQKVAKAEQARANNVSLNGQIYDVSQLDRQPRPTFQARPQFPFALRRAGIGGEATVDFVVDPNGNVINARAIKSGVSGEEMEQVVKMAPFSVTTEGDGGATTATINGMKAADAAKMIEAAAVEAVSKWKFAPGQKGGQIVGTHMQVPIVFTLNEEAPPKEGVQLSDPKR
jgi:RNA polymerase sigma factor (sigma-70 family)